MRREWSGWIKNRQWKEFETEARQDPSQVLANTVSELLLGFEDKADRRALKRILYFLSQAGYEPDAIAEPDPEPVPEEPASELAFLTTADSAGDADIVYGRPSDRRYRWLVAHVNETEGIVAAIEEESSIADHKVWFEKFASRIAKPILHAQVPVDFARWRLRQGLAKCRNGVPPTIAYWRGRFESASEVPHPALGLPAQTATETERREVLFAIEPALPWRLELGLIAPALNRLQEAQTAHPNASDEERKRRTYTIIDETRQDVFTEAVVQSHSVRLLDLAYVMDKQGQAGTGLVMATYFDLLDKKADSDYANAIMDKTVMIYVDSLSQAAQRAAEHQVR